MSTTTDAPVNALQGKTICFTGTLKSQSRAQASSAATAVGALVVKSVSYETNIVVCAPKAGAKKQQAKDKGCAIWTEAKFLSNLASAYAAMSGAIGAVAGTVVSQSTDDDDDNTKLPAAVVTPPTTPDRKVAANNRKSSPVAAEGVKKKSKPNATPGVRQVMKSISNPEDFVVYQDYDTKLMYSELISMNSNKFYRLQLLQEVEEPDCFYVATNWGRLGDAGQHQLKGPHDQERGIKVFCKVFRSKTKNNWDDNFVRCDGKYQLVETCMEGEGETDLQPLGRLLPLQINQGKEVLQDIRTALEKSQEVHNGGEATTTLRGRSSRSHNPTARDEKDLARLTGYYYSLIPTRGGWDQLPVFDTLEAVAEKESQLEFMMGLVGDDKK